MAKSSNCFDQSQYPFDALELKKQLHVLRQTKHDLVAERTFLNEEIYAVTARALLQRKELTLLGISEDIQFEDHLDDKKYDLSIGASKKALEFSRKLDIQLLNPDLKSSLSKLESEAISWELRLHNLSEAQFSLADLKSFQLVASSCRDLDLQRETGNDAISTIKSKLKRDLEILRSEKSQCQQELGSLRFSLRSKQDELGIRGCSLDSIQRELNVELAKIRLLSREEAISKNGDS